MSEILIHELLDDFEQVLGKDSKGDQKALAAAEETQG